VLDADGGTRTASITGGLVALAMCLDNLRRRGLVGPGVLREPIAAVSVGLLGTTPVLDLDYAEDSTAEVDLNVVATKSGRIIEVQGTAEGEPIDKAHFDALLDLALAAIPKLVAEQERALERAGIELGRLLPR
jgi:ribonuclease PH